MQQTSLYPSNPSILNLNRVPRRESGWDEKDNPSRRATDTPWWGAIRVIPSRTLSSSSLLRRRPLREVGLYPWHVYHTPSGPSVWTPEKEEEQERVNPEVREGAHRPRCPTPLSSLTRRSERLSPSTASQVLRPVAAYPRQWTPSPETEVLHLVLLLLLPLPVLLLPPVTLLVPSPVHRNRTLKTPTSLPYLLGLES